MYNKYLYCEDTKMSRSSHKKQHKNSKRTTTIIKFGTEVHSRAQQRVSATTGNARSKAFQHITRLFLFLTEEQKNRRPLCYGKGMSQCFTCDCELRGYMAMGKRVLTLTYIHAIPFGNLRFPHPVP